MILSSCLPFTPDTVGTEQCSTEAAPYPNRIGHCIYNSLSLTIIVCRQYLVEIKSGFSPLYLSNFLLYINEVKLLKALLLERYIVV